MWLNTRCLALLDMFSLMFAIGLDRFGLICANLKSSFSLVSVSLCREIHRTGATYFAQNMRSDMLYKILLCSLSGQRCLNSNFQAAPGRNSSSWALAAGRARDVARTPSTTAAPQRGVLWRPRTKVRQGWMSRAVNYHPFYNKNQSQYSNWSTSHIPNFFPTPLASSYHDDNSDYINADGVLWRF